MLHPRPPHASLLAASLIALLYTLGTAACGPGEEDEPTCIDTERRCDGDSAVEVCEDGAFVPFGACPGGTACEDGECVPDQDCTPSCDGRECGGDGCGGSCGACDQGEVCNVAGQCVERPLTCGDGTCDPDEDCVVCPEDCGACCGDGTCDPAMEENCLSCPEDCGCPDGTTCDPATLTCLCVPDCDGRECGSDGCWGSCGACDAGWTCNEAGRCVDETCTALTCEELLAECGAIDDSCGVELDCGGCPAGLACEDNVCLGTCDYGCPLGSTCDDLGICRGVQLDPMYIDVESRLITGTLTVNGSPLVPFANCANFSYRAGQVVFTDRDDEVNTTAMTVSCDGQFREPLHLAPGTYRVHVSGAGSNAPRGMALIDDAFVVTTDAVVVFDAGSRVIDGTIYVNGMPLVPSDTCANTYSSLAGTAYFTDRSDERNSSSVVIGCDGDFREPIHLAPGTYEVRLDGAGSNVPRGRLLVNDSFVVTTDFNAFFEAQSRIVDGMLFVNGAPLVSLTNCTSHSERAGRIHFTDNSDPAHTTSVRLWCDHNGVFPPIHLSPGTYSVHVEGAGSNAPRGRVLVDDSFTVTQDVSWSFSATSRVIDGTIYINGTPVVPFDTCSNDSSLAGTVHFTDRSDESISGSVRIACSGDFRDPIHLAPGTYEVHLEGARSNVPRGRLLVDDSFVVTTDFNAFFQAQSRIVDGMLFVNGAPLVSLTNCTSHSERAGRLHFTDNSDPAHTTSFRLLCDYNGVFLPIHLSPGTYSVHVEGAGSNLPRGRVLLDSSFSVTQDVSWSFSATSRVVYGSLWVNGGPLVPFANCSNYSWDAGRLFFTDLDDPANTTGVEISCGGNFGNGLHLAPGIYKIQVEGAGSNAPRGLATVISRLEIAL